MARLMKLCTALTFVAALLDLLHLSQGRSFRITHEGIDVTPDLDVPASGSVVNFGPLFSTLASDGSSADGTGAEAVGTKTAAAAASGNGTETESWWSDIFAHPKMVPDSQRDLVRDELFQPAQSDWAFLGAVVIVLVLLDALVLSRFTDENRLPEDIRSVLTRVFGGCDPTETGFAKKQDLLHALSRCEEAPLLFGVESRGHIDTIVESKLAAMGTTVTAEEFEAFYARAVWLSGSAASRSRSSALGTHAAVLAVWVILACAYNAAIWWQRGTDAAMQWCAGYALEWMLSMDNLFIFHLVFRTYSTPRALLQKALFIGILGAIVCRMGFFAIVEELMTLFRGVRIVMGLLLVYSGIQAAREEDDDEDVSDNFVMRCFRRVFGARIQSEYDLEGRLFVCSNASGRCEMTLLVPVILCLIVIDLLFALDSVSAKVAQIPNYYIAYSSSVLALFGMRSMFFIIQSLVDWFELLKYGLCAILVFIGMELMLEPFVKLPASSILVVICSVFVVCIAGSVARQRLSTSKGEEGKQGAGMEPQLAG